jgi:SAM-dependent methyltransferase
MLSSVPGGKQLYYYMGQRLLGGFRHFTIDEKVREGRLVLDPFYDLGESVAGRTAVEIGTGWTPVVPLLYWLHGQGRCDTYDVSRLMKPALVVEAVRQFVENTHLTSVVSNRWPGYDQRLSLLRDMVAQRASAETILQRCDIHYHAPADASATQLPDASVDLVYSNTVLEHVPFEIIRALLAEAYRIIRPGGFMLHLINPADHFSYSDPSITSMNFLQFSESEFSKYNTYFCYQNRLRPTRYHQLVEEAGFSIAYYHVHPNDKAVQQRPGVTLHADFAALPDDEICAQDVYVIARR